MCLFLGTLSAFLFLALMSFSPFDPGWTYLASDTQTISNLGGVVGAWIANLLRAFLGWASLLIPFCLCYEIYNIYHHRKASISRYTAQFFLIVIVAMLFSLCASQSPMTHSGGIIGYELATGFSQYITIYGAMLISLVFLVLTLTYAFSIHWTKLWHNLQQAPATLKDIFYIAQSDEQLLKQYHFERYYAEQEQQAQTATPADTLTTSQQTHHTTTADQHSTNTVHINAEQVVFGDVWQTNDKNQEHLQEIQNLLAQSQKQLSSLHELELKAQQRQVSTPNTMPVEPTDMTSLQVPSHTVELQQTTPLETQQLIQAEITQQNIENIDQRIHELHQQIAELKAQEQQRSQIEIPPISESNIHVTSPVFSSTVQQESQPTFDEIVATPQQDIDTVFPTQSEPQIALEPNLNTLDSHSLHLVRERLTQSNPLSDIDMMLDNSLPIHQTTPSYPTHAEDIDIHHIIQDIENANTHSNTIEKTSHLAFFDHLTADSNIPDTTTEFYHSEQTPLSMVESTIPITPTHQPMIQALPSVEMTDHDTFADNSQLIHNSQADDFDAPLTDASGRMISRAMQVVEHRKTLSPLPSLDLLDPVDYSKKVRFSDEELDHLAQLLELKLQDFNINASVEEITPGPIVTRFSLSLAPGVKATKVASISQDLARSMSLKSVRIVLSIPGTPFIGVEIPNKKREMVRLIELVDSEEFRNPKVALSVAMGKDITGKPVLTDIAKAPHMLIAGTTGSGKSVAVNAILLSLLLKYTPEQLRLVLIDPKMLELANYDEIPHLLTPVITDMNKATNALNWCVNEMERRYELMALFKLRQIAPFNERIRQAQERGEDLIDPLWKPTDSATQQRAPRLQPLPSIIVIADEFADMMMQQSGKKTEMLITRLAQKARAAGIHLLLATQRPSVDVITGLIKANIPTRAALRVNSKIDSRTILDAGGAEELLGHGDMLFLAPGQNEPERVHGAFISDDEVNRICDAWRERGSPNYVDNILDGDDDDESASSRGFDDSNEAPQDVLYDKAVEFVLRTRKASGSALQREFGIGYQRGAKLIDMMERNGIVSPATSSNKREILV